MHELKVDRRRRDPIADEHEELMFRLTQFREVLARRKIKPAALVDCIDALSDVVRAHFAHEEVDGYFDHIVQMAPHLTHKIDTLKEQHQAFRQALADLRSFASANPSCSEFWRQLTDSFQCFYERFGEHERTEDALLQEAYERDMGDSD